MPDKGQELFEIMDAALKRQREGLGASLRRQGVPATRAAGPSALRRADAPAHPSPGPVPSPAPPPVPAVPPDQPSDVLPAAAPQGPESWEAPPHEEQPAQAEGGAGSPSGYTQRLSRVLDSARSAPPAGSLTPGEVLRGTVFGKAKPTPPSEPVPAAPPPDASPRPMSIRGVTSGVYRTPVTGGVPVSGRQVSGVLRPVAGGPLPPGVSGPLPPAPPASQRLAQPAAPMSQRLTQPPVPASQRGVQPAAPTAGRGIFVPVEVAVLGMIGFMVLLIVAFFLGVSHGRDQSKISGSPDAVSTTDKPKPPTVPGGQEGIKTVEPGSVRHQDPGDRPKPPSGDRTPPPTPTGTGKWTVEVLRYPAGDKASADALSRKLAEKGFQGIEIIKKTVRGNQELAVCVGRFETRDDPRAEQTKQAIIGLDRRRYTNVVEVVKVE